jgi:hypothetical protein
VQRLKQLPRLRGVGVIDHVGIIAPTTAARAPGPLSKKPCRRASPVRVTSPRRCQRGAEEALVPATIAQ